MCTFVYAYPQKDMQPQLWKDILDLTPAIPGFRPWLLVGDFNNITNLAEKIGGNRTISNYMIEFNRFLSEGNLISIPASYVPFTWCNGHKDNTISYERLERLDRAIANSDWINLYPKASLHNYPIFGSDHGLILLDTNTMYNTNGACSTNFKFKAMWLAQTNFRNVVSRVWSEGMLGNSCDKVRGYLGRFKFLVHKWNKGYLWQPF